MAWVFCTKEDVMNLIPCTENELQDIWSDTVEQLIRDHLGKPSLGTYEVITDEYHNGTGISILKVRKPPIEAITSIIADDYSYPASDYVIFTNHVQLKYGAVFPLGTMNVVVSYTAGSYEISPTITLAAVTMIAAMLNYKRRAGADGSIKWGNVDKTIGNKQPISDIGLVKHLKTIMVTLLRRDRPRLG